MLFQAFHWCMLQTQKGHRCLPCSMLAMKMYLFSSASNSSIFRIANFNQVCYIYKKGHKMNNTEALTIHFPQQLIPCHPRKVLAYTKSVFHQAFYTIVLVAVIQPCVKATGTQSNDQTQQPHCNFQIYPNQGDTSCIAAITTVAGVWQAQHTLQCNPLLLS